MSDQFREQESNTATRIKRVLFQTRKSRSREGDKVKSFRDLAEIQKYFPMSVSKPKSLAILVSVQEA